jgi:hypothetical protein
MAKGNFIPTCDHSGVVEALADLVLNFHKNCPFEAPGPRFEWLKNEIKICLGVDGNIWPAEIYGACMIAGLEDAEARGAAHG